VLEKRERFQGRSLLVNHYADDTGYGSSVVISIDRAPLSPRTKLYNYGSGAGVPPRLTRLKLMVPVELQAAPIEIDGITVAQEAVPVTGESC